jgi:hypothetical protein
MNEIKIKNLRQDEQIKIILDKLNATETVSSEIKIEFPVPLDNDTVQFTIYDTPGTDSNYAAHQHVLTEALENQTQSILIFVAKPDGLEGSGNNALLNYLKEAENKHSKTSIDISRSLFVINKVDGQTSDARKTLQHQEIKDQKDGEFTIKLEDKKLFFTSALYGYVAKAVKNGIATPQDQSLMNVGKLLLASDGNPVSYCYRENRCASSEFATKTMIEKCEDKLQRAIADQNDADIVSVCSGMYALETEIVQYGEKYAAAVKAFAIIDSVDKALAKLTNQACSLRDSNREEIAKINRNIKELQDTIDSAIEKEYSNKTLTTSRAIPEETRKKLKIDSETLQKCLIGHTEIYLDDTLKGGFFGLGEVTFKESDKTRIKDGISSIIQEFTDTFLKAREDLLTNERDAFFDAVLDAINKNGNISDAAKKFFQEIPKPEISKSKGIENLDSIYNSNKRIEKVFFFFEKERLDKKSFIADVKDKLQSIATDMADDYAKDYQKALETILMSIKSNFQQNLEKYSLYMKAMIDNRNVMQKLGEKIEDAAQDLEECKDDLDKIIWKEN